MKLKFLVVFLAIAGTLCLAFGFAGCNEKEPDNAGRNPPVVDQNGEQDGAKRSDGGGQGSSQKPEKYSAGLEFTLNNDGAYSVTGIGECKDSEIVIPSEYEGKPVTSIGKEAFEGCEGLTSIVIADSVTSIGSWAFCDCIGLTSIDLPDGVTSIGNYAFYNTAYYNNGENWINDVLYIGDHLIKAKLISGSYSIREGTKTIGGSAFYHCSGLTSIDIPDGVTSIGDSAFYYCDGLTSVTLGSGVISIGVYAFRKCSGLTSIVIPDGVTSIGNVAFANCTGLTGELKIPDSVTSIGAGAFYNCSGLTEITIPSSMILIEKNAFLGCVGLKQVHFENPNGWIVSRNSNMSDAEAVSGLENPTQAAKYLKDTYRERYWKREE